MAAARSTLSLPVVRLFRAQTYDAGTPHERTWTTRDLDAVINNHRLLCKGPHAVYQPPIGVGHLHEMADGSHTAAPSYGIVSDLWREGRHLYGSFDELDPEVHEHMQRGRLRSLSVELYDSPEQAEISPELARGARGPMLRRVVLLGAHPPRVKGLGNPPWAAGERPRVVWSPAHHAAAYTFAEGGMADTEHLTSVAQQAGFSDRFLGTLDEEQLSSLVADLAGRMLGGGEGAPTGPNEPPATPEGEGTTDDDMAGLGAGGGEGEGGEMSREDMISALVQLGQDQSALEQMDDASLKELYDQLKTGGPAAGAPPGSAPPAVAMGEGAKVKPKPQVIQLTPATLKQLVTATARAALEKHSAPSKRQRVQEFCEQMVTAGYLTPAQAEDKPGTVFTRLLRASSLSRFGEGKSELEMQMEEIRSGPRLRTPGERLAVGSGGALRQGGAAGLSAERRAAVLGATPEGRALLKSEKKGA